MQYKLKYVNKNSAQANLEVKELLVLFYVVEMAKHFNWSVAYRYQKVLAAALMIETGHAKMLIAYNKHGKYCGMAITAKTDSPRIRRLEALLVSDAYRGMGVAKALIKEIKQSADLHAFATPNSASWYLANGFREVGQQADEGTIEMFTATYKPEYSFKHPNILMDESDWKVIRGIEELERREDSPATVS
ncbi:GNAT family N-acetyltransferase [Pseudomonas luteola]